MASDESAGYDPFPWHLNVHDAHCHPTDTVASLDSIPEMGAKVLTIMATRPEDQALVADTASRFGIQNKVDYSADRSQRVLPSFGWHPWFSHKLIADDGDCESLDNKNGRVDKVAHYKNVLSGAGEGDEEFLSALPDPIPLSRFLSDTESRLRNFPLALIGEVGLDRAFRIPINWLPGELESRDSDYTPGAREGRKLSPYRVQLGHQKKVLKAQLQLAGKMGRAVSVHSVQAHGAVFEILEELWKGRKKEVLSKSEKKRRKSVDGAHRLDEQEVERGADANGTIKQNGGRGEPLPYPPRICMHSYSGPPDPLKQFLHPSIPADIFFSFSNVINFSGPNPDKVEAVIKALPDDRILVESDLHTAGPRMDELLEDVVRRICDLRGWTLEDGITQLGKNWRGFAFGA
ncbi:MAG: hypothetical protein Q9227_008514 [Pyrenula ochraceoflavens]